MPARLLIASLATAPAIADAETATAQNVAMEPSPLPHGVAAMIDAALASGDASETEAVIRTARRALPQLADAIDRRVAAWTTSRGSVVAAVSAPPAGTPGIPPDPRRPGPRPAAVQAAQATKLSGEGEAGAFVNTGNAPGLGLVGAFKMLVEGENWRVGTNIRADYQEAAGVVTREQYRFSAEPNYKFDERGYIFGLGQYEKDRFQGFASRYSLSGGLGYKLFNDEDVKVNVKGGPAWRVTEPVGMERESVVAALASLEAKVALTPSLQYTQDASLYSDTTGSTFYSLAAIDSKLIGKLKARLSYMVQHETAPELGRLGTNTTSRFTLVYDF